MELMGGIMQENPGEFRTVRRHSGQGHEGPDDPESMVCEKWITGSSDVMPGLDPGTRNDKKYFLFSGKAG